ncbi:MAG: hypothetical protein K0R18_1346 [Bacillales bacterium]|jgi:hypothetical protein|nr:hypothetical protein [Bacillales bacterium]
MRVAGHQQFASLCWKSRMVKEYIEVYIIVTSYLVETFLNRN